MSLNRQFRQAEPAKALAKPKITAALVVVEPGPIAKQKRGPKPSGKAKRLLTLRLDQDVIAKFEATGPGWQARMNEALKAAKI